MLDNNLLAYAVLFIQPIAAAIGLIMNGFSLRNSYIDLRITEQLDGKKRLVAQAYVDQGLMHLICQGLLLTIGVLTFIAPPTPSVVADHTWVVVVNRSCLIAVTVLLALKSIMGLRYQHRMLRIWITEPDDCNNAG